MSWRIWRSPVPVVRVRDATVMTSMVLRHRLSHTIGTFHDVMLFAQCGGDMPNTKSCPCKCMPYMYVYSINYICMYVTVRSALSIQSARLAVKKLCVRILYIGMHKNS